MRSTRERPQYTARVEGRRSGILTWSKIRELDNGSRFAEENVN